MNNNLIEQARRAILEIKSNIQDDICYATIAGSHCFGLATEKSDIDIKGIFIAPTRQILGLNSFNAQDKTLFSTSPIYDYEFHEISKFLKLMLKCNPTVLEIAFVNDSFIIELNEIGKKLRELRQKVLFSNFNPKTDRANGIWATFYGYAQSQIIKGTKKILKDAEDKKPEFKELMPEKTVFWEIAIQQIYEDKGKQNLAEFINYNYDFKFFSHAIRLLSSGEHCLQTGEFLTVPPCKDFCAQILKGNIPLNKVIEFYSELNSNYENLKKENALPDSPDQEAFNEFLIEIRKKTLI